MFGRLLFAYGLSLLLLTAGGCGAPPDFSRRPATGVMPVATPTPRAPIKYESPILGKLVAAAVERTNHQVEYDPSYFKIDYPNGDVPAGKGVCTDEVIRSFRAIGVDLQQQVHEDMRDNFPLYPRKFGLTKTDPNIDHRRVPNLMTFFERKARVLPLSGDASDYVPGDVLTWDLGAGLTHIGVMVDVPSATPGRFLIMHNIGAGPRLEDVLFSWKLTGHYRYTGPPPSPNNSRPTATTPR